MSITIREAVNDDWPNCWAIIEPVFAAGDTYPYEDLSQEEARELWFDVPLKTYVAVDETLNVIGTYILKPNVTGRGDHVCNCGYVVDPKARGKGVASAMCVHSQEQAVELGFLAMQFNFVVASNEGAVRLWQKLGFEIIGTLPKVFRHASLGLVDAHIMFKKLTGLPVE